MNDSIEISSARYILPTCVLICVSSCSCPLFHCSANYSIALIASHALCNVKENAIIKEN